MSKVSYPVQATMRDEGKQEAIYHCTLCTDQYSGTNLWRVALVQDVTAVTFVVIAHKYCVVRHLFGLFGNVSLEEVC